MGFSRLSNWSFGTIETACKKIAPIKVQMVLEDQKRAGSENCFASFCKAFRLPSGDIAKLLIHADSWLKWPLTTSISPYLKFQRPLVVPRGAQGWSFHVVVTWVGLDSTWNKFLPNLKFSWELGGSLSPGVSVKALQGKGKSHFVPIAICSTVTPDRNSTNRLNLSTPSLLLSILQCSIYSCNSATMCLLITRRPAKGQAKQLAKGIVMSIGIPPRTYLKLLKHLYQKSSVIRVSWYLVLGVKASHVNK